MRTMAVIEYLGLKPRNGTVLGGSSFAAPSVAGDDGDQVRSVHCSARLLWSTRPAGAVLSDTL